uniref:Macro domain-containing protein n=1 Tax=Panagrellus redivivus TaxID=6233 RepID=A0A7E4ZXL3_PANRE
MAEPEDVAADENYDQEHHEPADEHTQAEAALDPHEHEHQHEPEKVEAGGQNHQDKVFIVEDSFENSSADCIVTTCSPGMEIGFGWFNELVESAGPGFAQELELFKNTTVGASKLFNSYDNKNFKCIIVMFVPEEFRSDVTPIEGQRVRSFCRNALDLAAEAGMRSIIFPPTFNKTGVYWVAPVLTRCFKEWCLESPYVYEFDEIRVVCVGRGDYDGYVTAATRLNPKTKSTKIKKRARRPLPITDEYYEEAAAAAAAELGDEPSPNATPSGRKKRNPNVDPIPNEDIEQMRTNGMFLVLSAKLEPTILNLKDEKGLKRQYRMTNRSRDGRKLYFRCSRCDTLAKRDKDSSTRARLILCNGQVSGDEYPTHHPDCEPWTDEQLLVQQIDRSSRKTVKEGLLQPFEAYQDALSRVTTAVANEAKIIDVPKFPEWSEVRQKTYRHREKRNDMDISQEEDHLVAQDEHEQMHQDDVAGEEALYENAEYIETHEGHAETEEIVHADQ